MTVDPSVLDNREGNSTRIFSREKPRPTDVANLWLTAIRRITSPYLILRTPLGQHLREPPGHQKWFSSMDESKLFHELEEDRWAVYSIPAENMVTRTPQYEWAYSMVGEKTYQKLASVDTIVSLRESGPPRRVRLQSTAMAHAPEQRGGSFLEELHSLPNQSLWKNFTCDGDGEWIRRGLINNSIVLVHDGSYMPQVDPNLCSAAFIIKCTSC